MQENSIHKRRKVNQRTDSLFFILPLPIICSIFKYLEYKEAFYFTLCLVSSKLDQLELDNKAESKKVCNLKQSLFFRSMFHTTISLKKKVLAPGFYFDENLGCKAWGANDSGQLGLNHITNQYKPQLISALKNKKILTIAVGGYHTLFLTSEFEVYSCGGNLFGQLGLGHNQDKCSPQLIKALRGKKIIAIAAGYNHSLFLTDTFEVLECGYKVGSSPGQTFMKERSVPRVIHELQDKKIIAITAEIGNSILLTNCFEVYSYSIAGIMYATPRRINFKDEKIIAIASGAYHSLFLTDKFQVYSCGNNCYGQLGLQNYLNQGNPQLITALKNKKVIAMATGLNHSLFLTEDFAVYSCGDNDFGQLGLGHFTNVNTPQLIAALKDNKIISIVAGCRTSHFLSESQNVFVCGLSYQDLLPDQKALKVNVPQQISFVDEVTEENNHGLLFKNAP